MLISGRQKKFEFDKRMCEVIFLSLLNEYSKMCYHSWLEKKERAYQLIGRAQWDFKNCLEELVHMFFNVKLNFKVGFFWNFFGLSPPWGRKMHICKCMGISMGKWPQKIKWPKITFPGSKVVPKVSKWGFRGGICIVKKS